MQTSKTTKQQRNNHQAELTAGYCATPDRDAYLPALAALARHGAGAVLAGAELADDGLPPAALASRDALIAQISCAAAALGVPVTLAAAGAAPPPRAQIGRAQL